jgi:ubiquinone/menaquinone biosynthesis C-methylase UbiE
LFHRDGPTLRELAVQALSSTERGYDLLAPKFDYTPFRTPDALLDAVAAALLDRSGSASFARGLDVCCGTGAGMRLLRSMCRDHVVGFDISRGMLSVARQRMSGFSGDARLELVRGDALELPFGPAFDIVVCFGALGHVLKADRSRFVAEIARVLRPGGKFVFVTSYMPPPWSGRYWASRSFNAAMQLRNALISPPFVMYYLTFLLPEVQRLLEQSGLTAEVSRLGFSAGEREELRLVIATRDPS